MEMMKRYLMIDVGAGTLDLLYYDEFSGEHFKAVVKSPVRTLADKIESLAFQDVYGRVVNVLLQMSNTEGDKRIVKETLTHQEISNMVGASREMVSKIIKELSVGGYLTTEKKSITINKPLPLSF